MGNRVSTSTSPYSLEELEAIARGSSSNSTAVSSGYPLSPFDAVAVDLAAAVAAPGSNGAGAACKGSGGAASNVVDNGNVIGSSINNAVRLRRENIKAEVEQLFADVDTSLHALRCVPDFSRGHRLPLRRQESRHSDPLGGLNNADLGHDGGGSKDRVQSSMGSGRATKRRAHSTRTDATKGTAASASASPFSISPPGQHCGESPRSWIFRDVSVQPLDLSQAVDVNPCEVYVVVLVQRSTAANRVSPLPPTVGVSSPNYSAAAALSMESTKHQSSSGARCAGHMQGGTTAAPAAAGGDAGCSGGGSAAEWPREMVQSFTPRGLSTPFSSDINRPSSGVFYPSGAAAFFAASPSATPRTNGSMSNRPTPRSGGTAVPGSPRSVSSMPTPRATDFHYSIHLLTGKQADALTAAAGFLTARSLEKLFLEYPDFDRGLFYRVNTLKAEEAIRAYNLYFSVPSKADGPAVRARGNSKGFNGGGRAALSPTSGPAGASQVSSGRAARGGIRRGSDMDEPVAPMAHGATGASQSSSPNNFMPALSAVSKGSFLYALTATQEAVKELLREILAAMRPVPVVAPRFERRGETPTSPESAASPLTHVAGSSTDSMTVAPSSLSELYGVNALFRVLSGVRTGTPRWSHGGEMQSPLSSARFAFSGATPGSANGAGTPNHAVGMSSWHHDPLPSFRMPRRGPSASVIDTANATTMATTATGTHEGDFKLPSGASSWLQGPQPLDVLSAAPAAAAVTTTTLETPTSNTILPPPPLSSPTSTTSRGTNGLPAARPWSAGPVLKQMPASGHPYSPSTATHPQLLSLPKLRRPAPLNGPPSVTQTATPSLVTTPQHHTTQPKFSLPFDVLLSKVPSSSHRLHLPAEAIKTSELKPSQDAALPMEHTSNSGSADVRGTALAEQVDPTQHQRADPKRDGTPTKKFHSQERRITPDEATDAAHADSRINDDEDYNEVSTQQERVQRLKAAQPEVTEVLPYLFVGGETAARDRAQMLRKGITHVVNTVSWCLDNFYPDVFQYLTLNLSDAADEPVFSLFVVVNTFVEKARRANHNNGRVFIHCQQGVSRSCTFVMAYVMWKLGMCYDRAYELVRARRNVCSPNTGFLMNLRLWEAHLANPQLNLIYAFAPYSAELPTPFAYQLVSYYACSTTSTEDTAEMLQESRDNYYQLCGDVLRRAVDCRRSAVVDDIVLDPRMCYVLMCAPRRTRLKEPIAEGTSIPAAAAGEVHHDAEHCIEACFLVGASCTQTEYVEQAFIAFQDLLQHGYYHGDAHTSTDNNGRVMRFAPLRRVHVSPSAAAMSNTSSYSPAFAASVEDAQALFARHVVGSCSITYATQPQWEELLSLPNLSTKLAQYSAENKAADAGEAARCRTRKAELAKLASRNDPNASNSVAAPAAPASRAPSASVSHPLRSSRHTPRTLRQSQTTVGSGGVVLQSSEAEKPSFSIALAPSLLPLEVQADPRTSSNSSKHQHSKKSRVVGAAVPTLSALPTAALALDGSRKSLTVPVKESHLPSHLLHASPLHQHAADGAAESGASGSAAGALPQRFSDPSKPLPAGNRADTVQPSHTVLGKAEISSQRHAGVPHAALSGEDSFAYAYPFTAASKVLVADLDDLEAEVCYVVGFQQPNGVSVYIWRGARSPLEVQEVLNAFVERMLEAPKDAAGVEAVQQALTHQQWTTCSLYLPLGDDGDEGGSAGAHGAVLPNVRVLFVEQGEEPEEFVTLL